jgi:hypothetical protein
MERIQVHGHWQALVLVVLNLGFCYHRVKMDLREIGCEDGSWMELTQDHVQWWALVLTVLNFWVLLPES